MVDIYLQLFWFQATIFSTWERRSCLCAFSPNIKGPLYYQLSHACWQNSQRLKLLFTIFQKFAVKPPQCVMGLISVSIAFTQVCWSFGVNARGTCFRLKYWSHSLKNLHKKSYTTKWHVCAYMEAAIKKDKTTFIKDYIKSSKFNSEMPRSFR